MIEVLKFKKIKLDNFESGRKNWYVKFCLYTIRIRTVYKNFGFYIIVGT